MLDLVLSLRALLRLRIYVAAGLVLALLLAVAVTFHVRLSLPPKLTSRQVRTWVANSVMLVDSQRSAIGDVNQGLDPLIPRATVYANLMTSPALVDLIGLAARVPGDEIAVSGPVGVNGQRPQHGATVPPRGSARYTLQLNTDETQPLIRVTARAPTSAAAVALANAAAAGLSSYVTRIEDRQAIPLSERVEVQDLGQPTSSPSDSGLAPPLGIVLFLGLSTAWCMLVLLVSRFRQTWRSAAAELRPDVSETPASEVIPGPPPAWDLDSVDPWAEVDATESEHEPAAVAHRYDRADGDADFEPSSVHMTGRPAPNGELDSTGPASTAEIGDGYARATHHAAVAHKPPARSQWRWLGRGDPRP